MRASHLLFMATAHGSRLPAHGYRSLVTHIFVKGDELFEQGDELFESDSVFGERESLVMDFQQHAADELAPDGRDITGETWSSTRFDIVLAPEAE